MNSARAFLEGIIDYAGLFPPASLDMQTAVERYAFYLSGENRDLLGRFILPVQRLDEFENAVALLPSDDEWKVSIIAGDDVVSASDAAKDFNDRHRRGFCATIDTIEGPARSIEGIERASTLADSFKIYLEVPLSPDPRQLLEAISRTAASAKMRTGGIAESAIPEAEDVLRFIETCIDLDVPFKATAGLHHLVRGKYRLTYEPESPYGNMFGYLNIFIASAFALEHKHDAALNALGEMNESNFRFTEAGVHWRDHSLTWPTLARVRESVATSFGSCSFDEPVTEAMAASII